MKLPSEFEARTLEWMGEESSGGNQRKDAVSRCEKADPAKFSLHYRLLHGGESRMAVPTL